MVSSLDRSCYVSEKCLLTWGCTRGERRGNHTGNVGSFLDSSASLLVGSGSFWRLGLVSCQGRSLLCSKIPSPHVLACLQLSSHPLVTHSQHFEWDPETLMAVVKLRTGVISQMAVWLPLLVSLCFIDL